MAVDRRFETWHVRVGAIVGVKIVLLLAVAGRWGYHRDEPYYVLGGRHLDWGYVDHPPLTPALARLATTAFGDSLAGLRVLPALVGAAVIVVAAGTARLLGGRDGAGRAPVLAALAALACPLLLATSHWFQTVPFDQLLGSLAMLVWLRLLVPGANPRWWLVLGVVIGVGLENKWTMLLVAAAVAIGTLAGPTLRPQLRRPWPWLGAALAAGLWLPNLLWQIDHGWPTLDFIRENSAAERDDGGPLGFVVFQLPLLGLPLLVLGAAGLVWCWRRETWRPAAVGVGTILLTLTVLGAKPYYHGPFLPLLFASGAIAADAWAATSRRRLVTVVAWIGVWGLVPVPITLPVLSPATAADVGVFDLNEELAEELGWPELVDQVAAARRGLPADEQAESRVLTRSYGEAAAVELLGPDRGIPEGTALSGQNSYADWWPDGAPAETATVIAVRFRPATLAPYFGSCEVVDHLRNDAGVENETAGAPVLVCRDLRVSPEDLRAALRFAR